MVFTKRLREGYLVRFHYLPPRVKRASRKAG
jgi:hypothetical protein